MLEILILVFLLVATFYLLWKHLKKRIYLSLIPLVLAIVFSFISPVATRLIPIPFLIIIGPVFLFAGIAMAVIIPFPFLMDNFRVTPKEILIIICAILTYAAVFIPGFGCITGQCNPTILALFVDGFHLTGDAAKTSQFLIQVCVTLVIATGVYGLLLLCETLWDGIKKREIKAIVLFAGLVGLFFLVGASILIGFLVISLFYIFREIPIRIVRIMTVILFLVVLCVLDAYVLSLLVQNTKIDGTLFSALLVGLAIVLTLFLGSLEKGSGRLEKEIMIISILTSVAASVFVSWIYSPNLPLIKTIGVAFDIGHPAPGLPFWEGIVYLGSLLGSSIIFGYIIVLGYKRVIHRQRNPVSGE
jgi:hypothetical protein